MDLARLFHRAGVLTLATALFMPALGLATLFTGELFGLGPKGYLVLLGAGLAAGGVLYAMGTLIEVRRDGRQAAGLK